MPWVIDASAAASWVFHDEENEWSLNLQDRLRVDSAFAPWLWFYEVRNVLLGGERRRRITEAQSDALLRNLELLPIELRPPGDSFKTLTMARKYRLTFYDAAYLELAQREACPLATLDKDLARAARKVGIELL